jgi:anhydro-N-acetylmuramic acid kinase
MSAPIKHLLPPEGPWTVLGIMSGTSADGVDLAAIRADPGAFHSGRPFLELLSHQHAAYPSDLRSEVLAAASDRLDPSRLCILQRKVGAHHAEAAQAVMADPGLRPHLASLHGQTVQHRPDEGATLQLADPYLLAEVLQCPVVWDLRRRDLAVGGQGAPMVPLTELWLRGRGMPWVAVNFGGIANATVWDGTSLKAWDLGPGMSLLDLGAQRWLGLPYDPEGAHAVGPHAEALLQRWMQHPHFHRPPPKSTGREVFGADWMSSEAPGMDRLTPAERLSTLAAFTAEGVRSEMAAWGPALPPGTTMLLSGGGTRHQRVLAELAARMPGFSLEVDAAFPSGAREAISWALLGAASALGIPGNLPEVTGARKKVVLGSWVLP